MNQVITKKFAALTIKIAAVLFLITAAASVSAQSLSCLTSVSAGANQSQCSASFTMNATTPPLFGYGVWSIVSGSATIASSSSNKTSVTLGSSVATLKWTVSRFGCTTLSSTVTLTNLSPTPANAGAAQTKCNNNVFTLAANTPASGETGTWSIVSGAATITNINSATSTVTVTSSPAVLRWTIVKGNCSTTSTVTLTNNISTTANAGAAQSNCNSNVFTMAANAVSAGETGTWSVVSGTASITTTSSPASKVTVSSSPAVLRWTITKGSCSTNSTVTLTNTTLTTANAGAAQTKCNNAVFTLAGNAAATSETGTWSVVSGAANITNINSRTSSVTVTASPAVLRWTITKGSCSTSSTVTLTNNVTAASAGPAQTNCNNKVFTLAATAAGAGQTGTWSVVSGTASVANVNSPTSSVTVSSSSALLRWTVAIGSCSSNSTVTLTNTTLTTANAGATQTNCDNPVFNLAANAAGTNETGTWSVASGAASIANKNLRTSAVTVTASPAVLNWTIAKGNCVTTSPVTLINKIVTVSNAGVAQTVYGTSTPITLAANVPAEGTGEWSEIASPGKDKSQFSNISDPSAVFTPVNGAGKYILQWKITNAPCNGVSVSTVAITVKDNNIAPVADAGKDTIILLPANSVKLDGSKSTDTDGTINSYEWSYVSGPVNYAINAAQNVTTAVTDLTEGLYSFRLKITDNAGGESYDTVIVSVGNRVLVDIGYNSLTNSPDGNGKYWNNLTNAQEGVRVADAVSITNVPTGINLEVVNRVDGTYSTSANGLYTNSGTGVVGDVGDYPATATDDYAYVHPSATNGQWKLTGLDSLQQYSVKFWGSKLADTRFVEIKRADETAWKEYDAANNRDYNRAAVFTFSGKKEMAFDIRTKSGSVFGYINVVDITSYAAGYAAEIITTHDTIVTNPPATHDSDLLNCGKAIKIVILGSSTAYGNGATPIENSWANKFTDYVTRKNPESEVINLGVPGYTTYQVLCPDGFTPPADRPSPKAGNNITEAIRLGANAIIINLPTNDAANNFTLQEQKDNFERAVVLAAENNISVWVTTTQPRNNLSNAQVDNLFSMRDWINTRFGKTAIDFWSTVAATDGSIEDAYKYDDVHVNNSGHELFYERVVSERILDSLCSIYDGSYNEAPVANAGRDTTLMLPFNSIVLNGNGSTDADGAVLGYKWTYISGPAIYQLADASAASTTLSNLQEGKYAFELEVTDNGGAISFDTVSITVGNRILVDIGYNTLTSGPDAGGKYWNNLTNAQNGIRIPNAVNIGNAATGIAVEVVNRIDGTYSPSNNGLFNNASTGTVGDVGDYPATATDDYAYAHPSATNGQWKISGLDSLKQYTIKFWGSKLGVNTRFIEIKRADATVWQEYDASNNRDYNKAAVFTFSGKKEMTFDIRVQSGSTFGYINIIDIVALKNTNDIPATVITRGPYMNSDLQNSIIIKWRTAKATDSKVSFGSDAAALTQSVTDNTLTTDHTVTVTGLNANTQYYYSVGSSVQILQGDANNYFKTAPATGSTQKIRVLVMGDMGNNSDNQAKVRDAYMAFNGSNYTDGFIMLGDNAYNSGTDNEYQSNFFDYYQGNILKNHVLWPAPGNHDYAENDNRRLDHNVPYFDIFNLPKSGEAGGVASNTEAYYAYNYGNIHFVSLDSYGFGTDGKGLEDTTGVQVQWLKQDLAANTLPWTIVFFHHPPYTKGSHNSDQEVDLARIRERVVPILERYKVDMVLNGHSHSYERSFLINGHYGASNTFTLADNALNASSGKYDGSNNSCVYTKNTSEVRNGIVYAVVGSAGQLEGSYDETTHPAMYYSNFTDGGSMFFEVENNRLDAKWIGADGVVRDNFTIMKDVNNTKNITVNPGTDVTLTASWTGKYNWSTGATTRAVTVNPTVNTTYTVTDASGCISDVFNVNTGTALGRPVSAAKKGTATEIQQQPKVYPTLVRRGYPVTVQTGTAEQTEMILTNVSGAILKRFRFASSIKVETGSLLPGIYLLRDSSGRINTRIVVTD